jgi:type I restriction enzyme M protein
VTELADRYENTLPDLEATVADYETKVKNHLKEMGFEV